MTKRINARLSLSTPLELARRDGRPREFQARLIRTGRIRYADNSPGPFAIPAEAIRAAVALGQLNALPTFIDHAGPLESPSLRNLAGSVTKARWNEQEQAAEGTIRLLDTESGRLVDDLFSQLLADSEAGEPMPDVGLSLVFWPQWESRTDDTEPLTLLSFRHVESVDFVFQPAADGRILAALQRLSVQSVVATLRGRPKEKPMQTIEPFLAILFLAFLAEGFTEYLARPIMEGLTKPDPEPPQQLYTKPLWLRYVAALIGIGLAIAYRADLLGMVGLVAWSPWIGYGITGIIIGRGSNYLHDLVDRWLAPNPKPADRP